MAGKNLKRCALLAALAAAGCFSKNFVRGPGDPERGVAVQWWGHSCFSFEDSTGRRLLIDPFDETVGYSPPSDHPTLVLVTHDHFDHNAVPREGAHYDLVTTSGTHTADGIEITGILGYHDAVFGKQHGATLFFTWSMGGLTFAHLGDVGQTEFTQAQIEALRNVDVLFVPVGGKTTVDARGAAALVRTLNPKIVVPMHYGNERVRFFEFDPTEPFLKYFENVQFLPNAQWRVQMSLLPEGTVVYVPALP